MQPYQDKTVYVRVGKTIVSHYENEPNSGHPIGKNDEMEVHPPTGQKLLKWIQWNCLD